MTTIYLDRSISWDEFHEIAAQFNNTNCNFKSGHWWSDYTKKDHATRNMTKTDGGFICHTSDFNDGRISTFIFISTDMKCIRISDGWYGREGIEKELKIRGIKFTRILGG